VGYFLTRQEAADLIEYHPSTIWEWERVGLLPRRRYHGRAIYLRHEIERASHKVAAYGPKRTAGSVARAAGGSYLQLTCPQFRRRRKR